MKGRWKEVPVRPFSFNTVPGGAPEVLELVALTGCVFSMSHEMGLICCLCSPERAGQTNFIQCHPFCLIALSIVVRLSLEEG